MEGPNKGPSPKKGFLGHKISNSCTKESNENDCSSQHHMKAKVQTPKKPMSKHFMSPTISAASKVAVPRKKILGERNGISPFSETYSQKSSNFVPRNDLSGHVSPKIISSNCFGLEADDDEESVVNDYDPSSRYLSPRPKYLRYNPNRRREFLLQLEGEEERDSSGDADSDFQNVLDEEVSSVDDEISPSGGENDSLDPENGTSLGVEVEDHGDEDKVVEEFEEEAVRYEKGASLRVEVEEYGYEDNVVKEFEEEAEGYEEGASHKIVKEQNYGDEVELNDEEVQEVFEEEAELYEEVRGRWSLKGIMKFLVILSIFVLAIPILFSMDSVVLNSEEVAASTKDGYNRNQEHTSKDAALCMAEDGYEIYMGVVNLDSNDVILVEDSEKRMMESGHHEQVEDELPEQYFDQLNVTTNAANVNSNYGGEMATKVGWNEAQPIEDDELSEQYFDQLHVATNAANINSNYGGEMVTKVEWNEAQPIEDEWHTLSNQLIRFGNAESANSINGGEVETNVEDECQQFPDQQIESDKAEIDPRDDLVLQGRKEQTRLVGDHDPLDKDDMVESKDVLEDATVETIAPSETRLLQVKNKANGIGIIGALLSMISGSLFFISRSKGRNSSKGPPLVSKIIPIDKLDLTNESCPVTPKVEEKKIAKLAEPRAASSLLGFSEKATKEFSKISSPTVQLLGELVVREVERSLRRCDRDQKGSELIESEESNNIHERKKKVMFNISSPAIAPALEFSTADSASCYGSFTTEAKVVKKENGRDAELTTPVRRSSRIRSRSMTSS